MVYTSWGATEHRVKEKEYKGLPNSSGSYRVLRGASWGDRNDEYLQSAFRYGSVPGGRGGRRGFRLARTVK
jgi:formylglycine-generating enzyme required for sulfatase activity